VSINAATGSEERIFIDDIHDGRHRLRAEALARESLVFMLQLPQEGIAAFVYTWASGLGKAGSAFVVYGPAVGEVVADFVDGLEVAEDRGFDDWTVGQVTVRHGKPFKEAHVTVASGGRAALDYRFEAVHPAFNYGSHPAGCPGWVADERIEQSGRVRGTITLDGREIPFDTMGHRDHSWGTRDWFFSQHWKWLEAQAGPERVVHFWQVEALGRTVLRGYVLRDGQIAEVTDVDVRFEHDAALTHTSVEAVVSDALGRSTLVKGTTFAAYPFVVSPEITLNECSMAVTIDGHEGVGHVEMAWPSAYLKHVASKGIQPGAAILRGLE